MKKTLLLFILVCSTYLYSQTSQYVSFPDINSDISPNKARIYVIRPTGKLSHYYITLASNGSMIGRLDYKNYLCWDVDSGIYNLEGAFEGNRIRKDLTENKDFFTINAKAGKTYYIRLSPAYGLTTGKASFDIINPEKAKEYLKKFPQPKVKYAN